jgi:hypothetical protein
MDLEEIRKLHAEAERKAASMTGPDREAWATMAEQWSILARLRERLSQREAAKPGLGRR